MMAEGDELQDPDRFESWLNSHFETGFFALRFVTLVPVILAFAGCLLMFYVGGVETWHAIETVFNGEGKGDLATETTAQIFVIKAIDAFLLGLVLLIFSFGIYDLFVSKLDPADKPGVRPNWMRFNSISGLKITLAEVVIIILTITFFDLVLQNSDIFGEGDAWSFIVIPVGVALIAVAIGVFNALTHSHGSSSTSSDDGT